MYWLSKVFYALPGIFTVVKDLVELVEVPGHGPQKKQAVLDMIDAGYDVAAELYPEAKVLEKETVRKVADRAIDAVVAIKNATGQFRKGQ